MVVAVMMVVPTAFAVTIPFEIVATFVLLLDQDIALFVALAGVIVGVNVWVLPTLIVAEALSNEIPVTLTVEVEVEPTPMAVNAVFIAVTSALVAPYKSVAA